MQKKSISYSEAGVHIGAQEEALARAKQAIRASFTPGVMSDIGLFGGLFDPSKMGFKDAVLVASADGVGTKLDVAKRARVYDGVGRDLVQHCINDILCQGARPLFFLDYVGTGVLEPHLVSSLIEGCAVACREHGLALLGGETAEMPGMYQGGDFDLVGFIVGAVQREHIIDGSRVRAGQRLIGVASDGLHTNGYSLARRILFDELKLELSSRPAELAGLSVQQALLAPHRCYLKPFWPLIESRELCGFAHITGGGIPGNVVRLLRDVDAIVDRSTWELPGLFQLLTGAGMVERDEAYRAFNMGVGAVLFIEPERVSVVQEALKQSGETAFEIGEVVRGTGKVRYSR